MTLHKGIIPFSWDEVRVGDRIIYSPIQKINEFGEKIDNFTYKVKNKSNMRRYIELDGFCNINNDVMNSYLYLFGIHCTMEFNQSEYYIDRRPRYKRLFSSF